MAGSAKGIPALPLDGHDAATSLKGEIHPEPVGTVRSHESKTIGKGRRSRAGATVPGEASPSTIKTTAARTLQGKVTPLQKVCTQPREEAGLKGSVAPVATVRGQTGSRPEEPGEP